MLVISPMIHRWFMSKGKKAQDQYSTIRIPIELSNALDGLLGTKGFRSKAEIVKEALRHLLLEYRIMPMFQHFNLDELDERGVKVLDYRLNRIVDVIVRPEGIMCAYCESSDCVHVKHLLTVPSIQDVIRKRRKDGWDLPEV